MTQIVMALFPHISYHISESVESHKNWGAVKDKSSHKTLLIMIVLMICPLPILTQGLAQDKRRVKGARVSLTGSLSKKKRLAAKRHSLDASRIKKRSTEIKKKTKKKGGKEKMTKSNLTRSNKFVTAFHRKPQNSQKEF